MKNLVIAFLLSFFVSIHALACSVAGEPPSTAENFADADHVLLAKIVSAKVVKNPTPSFPGDNELVEATYETIELFKGSSEPPVVREEIYGPGNCTLGLLVGNTYLFFLSGPERSAGWPSGSTMLWNLDGTQVKPLLEELRKLKNETKKSN